MEAFYTHKKFLEWYIRKTSGDIVECGTGDGSTGFILDLIKGTNRKLLSLENNYEWYNKMLIKYPETENHKYIFVKDWDKEISNLDKDKYDIVFIDQSPWSARVTTMNHFLNSAKYIIIHDVDYFPRNGIFGKCISQFEFDFSDKFNKWKLYYPSTPWPCSTGPPTLVGSNVKDTCVCSI